MPAIAIVGTSSRVVDAPGLKIDELAGNVASKEDRISIAFVKADAGTSEPWLTLDYDEWMCILKGEIHFESAEFTSAAPLKASAGQTVFIQKGTRFRPSFPEDAEYVPVCLPAFRPDRCIREDECDENKAIGANLKVLHGTDKKQSCVAPGEETAPEVLYHMLTKAEWEAAKASGEAYFPKEYGQDRRYTHATAVPSRLITTANQFYQDVPGDWVCLRFTRSALKKCGISVVDEEALPVGDKPVGESWGNWVCPHVIGGIPPHIVDQEFAMTRDGCKFLGIEGLA